MRAVKGNVFIPSMLSNPVWFNGHGQTGIIGIKEKLNAKMGLHKFTQFKYDKRETFVF